MYQKIIFLLFIISFGICERLVAQDLTLTQFDLAPLQLNPSKAGDFEGKIRFSSIYEDQWRSILGKESYQSAAAGFDVKIPMGKSYMIGVGVSSGFTIAGSAGFRNDNAGFSGSITRYLGNIKTISHSLAIGFNYGYSFRRVEAGNFQMNGGLIKINYPDFGAGILWKMNTSKRYRAELGYAIFHFNEPNISLLGSQDVFLMPMNHFHGSAEIPLTNFSFIPSFIVFKQGFGSSYQVQLANRFYLKESKFKNWIQLGFVINPTTLPNQLYDIPVFGLTAQLNVKNIRVGLSFGRFRELESNAFEFSFGFVLEQRALNSLGRY